MITVKISKNFSLSELIRTNTGLVNTSDIQSLVNMVHLSLMILQPLRGYLGCAVNVNSCFRSKAVNKNVGGSGSSQHLLGQAVDFVCEDMVAAFNYILNNLPFDQLIWEKGTESSPAWIHVSYNPWGKNRKKVFFTRNGSNKYYNTLQECYAAA